MDEYATAISTHGKEFGDGFLVSLKAFKDNLSAGHDQYFKKYFMFPIFPVTAVFYGIVAAAMVLFFPVFLVVWALSPSTIWQLLLLIPLWSFNICRRISPMENDHLFFERMRQLDPDLADELETKCNSIAPQKWYDAVKDSLKGTSSFIMWCVGLILLSLIPVVGAPLAYIGESYLIARSLGCDLLEVFTKEIEGMGYEEREMWFKQREWRIIGFAAPLTLILSIPFVGPMLLMYAQAMTADFFLHLMALEPIQQPSAEVAGEVAAPSTSTSITIPTEAVVETAPTEQATQATQQEKQQPQKQQPQQAPSTALISIESSS